MKYKTIIFTIFLSILFTSCSSQKIDNSEYQLFTWKNLPKTIFFERKNIKEFINKNKQKHYYEVVYITSANIDWDQASFLAQDAGGYLVSINSKEENRFIYNLVSNQTWKYIHWAKNLKENGNSILTFGKVNELKKVSGFIIEYEKNSIK